MKSITNQAIEYLFMRSLSNKEERLAVHVSKHSILPERVKSMEKVLQICHIEMFMGSYPQSRTFVHRVIHNWELNFVALTNISR